MIIHTFVLLTNNGELFEVAFHTSFSVDYKGTVFVVERFRRRTEWYRLTTGKNGIILVSESYLSAIFGCRVLPCIQSFCTIFRAEFQRDIIR